MNAPIDFERARFNMIEQQIRPWDVLDLQVLELLSLVRREDFVPLAHKALAFTDMQIPLLQPTDEVLTVTSGATAQSGKPRTTGLGLNEIMTQIEVRTGRQHKLPGLAPVRGSVEVTTQH